MTEKALARQIAGEITLSDNPAKTLKKWRLIFGLEQKALAFALGVSASVVSDYESGRRKNPGAAYIKKNVEALTAYDSKKGGEFEEKQSLKRQESAILAMREFLEPKPLKTLVSKVRGKTVSGKADGRFWGYTVVDSIQAILTLSDKEFAGIYGATLERALVFTKVGTGRSPMIALKVTQPKPAAVVLHGLSPSKVDRLAIKIAEVSDIPLIVSTIKDEGKIVEKLGEIGL